MTIVSTKWAWFDPESRTKRMFWPDMLSLPEIDFPFFMGMLAGQRLPMPPDNLTWEECFKRYLWVREHVKELRNNSLAPPPDDCMLYPASRVYELLVKQGLRKKEKANEISERNSD